MTSWVSFLVTILVCSQNITGIFGRFPTNRNGDKFTNMVVKGTDTIYVAENGFVHTLDASLNPLKNFSTCAGDNCVNINKILAVFGDMLVLCGTGNDGICQVWNGTQLIYNSSTTRVDHNLVVSSDSDRPAVGLVHGEDLFIGVTYGPGIKTTENTYKHLVSRRYIKNSFNTSEFVDLKENINENYLVYFKKVFEHEGFIYLLTNQKLKTDSVRYISKLVRMCINETIENRLTEEPIKSYTDISMSCYVDGGDFNLLQDAEFLKENGTLVAAFAKGDHPDHPQSGSAICVYTIDTVNAAILKAKEDFITCNTTGSIERESAYLDIELPQCLPQSTYQKEKDDYICPKDQGKGTKVIGTNTLQPTTAYRIVDTSITIKTVKGVERYSLYPDIFLGTDKGSMNKITILDDLTVYEYESREIDKGHPVLGIDEIENYTYVLTDRKVFRVKNTECSTYTTCKETMAAKNPSCGWCVGENRSTKRNECHDTWLSSLSECVRMIASPKYISVESRRNVDININITNLPSNVTTNSLKCRYFDGNVLLGASINVSGRDGMFYCKDPGLLEHKLLRLQLTYMGTDVFPLAETTIQVYRCTQYNKCGMCRISSEVNCKWCVSSATCNQNQHSCSGDTVVQGNANECPRLLENTDIYIPNGISEIIELKTNNLVEGITYKCVVENQTEEIPANFIANALKCALNITFEDDSSKKQFPISIRQKDGSRKIELDEDQRSYVTVYNCGKLASDCTMCNALKKARYSCSWCNATESCVHNSLCTESVIGCPAPNITKIKPGSIGFKGGAIITISGTNFGTDAQQISPVHVTVQGASSAITVNCIDKEINKPTDADFEHFIISIKCKIQVNDKSDEDESLVDQVGNVTFSYNKVQAEPGTLTFKKPTITSIKPGRGPIIGGTEITMKGMGFVIGDGLTDLNLGSLSGLYSFMVLDKEIMITTPTVSKPLEINVITLRYDGEKYESKTITFSYLLSPVLFDAPLKSILSGGTIISLKGEHLQNSEGLKVASIYAGEQKEGQCTVASQGEMKCQLPEGPESLKQEMADNGQGRKRSTFDSSITATLRIEMDGYVKTFELKYYKDPSFDQISTPVLKTENSKLTLTGRYLTLAARASDYTVTIGLDNTCDQITVTETILKCYLPTIDVEEDTQDHAVVVRLGNFHQTVTSVRYQQLGAATSQNVLIIVLPIAGGLFLLGVIGTAVFCVKYRRIKARTPKIRRREHKNTQHDDVIGTPNRSTSFPTNRTDDQIMGQSTYMELDHSQNPGPNYESLDQNQDHDQQMIANQSSNTGIGQFNDPDTVYEGLDRNQDHDRHIYLGLDKKKVTKNV